MQQDSAQIEVDQASVDVIKTILESENGKRFFVDYLRANLKINLTAYVDKIVCDITFDGFIINKIISSTVINSSSF